MKPIHFFFVMVFSLLANVVVAQNTSSKILHKYIIERDIPNVGELSVLQLKEVASKSCQAIHQTADKVQWVESYVTENKVYCIYLAPDEAAVMDHAKAAGFPANKISEVKNIIDPTSAQ